MAQVSPVGHGHIGATAEEATGVHHKVNGTASLTDLDQSSHYYKTTMPSAFGILDSTEVCRLHYEQLLR